MIGKNKVKVLNINIAGELLIWLLVVLFFVSLTSLGIIFKEKNDTNDYQIFLQDADGLIVGSPVRMMGVEVGHVTKIKPMNNEVYIKFILTNPEVSIPQGTCVTVEFSGLAGSKSLELYLPDSKTIIDISTPLIQEVSPKRLHDAMSLLNNMFKKLGSIIYTTSNFGTKLQENDLTPSNMIKSNNEMGKFLDYTNEFLEESNNKAGLMRKSIEELREHVK